MLTFKKFIQEQNLITRLKEHYIKRPLNKSQEKILTLIVNKILHLDQINHNGQDLDLISKLFEDSVPIEKRRKVGEIYTPVEIIKYILEKVGYKDDEHIINKKIIDISCGSGSFLINACAILKKAILKNHKADLVDFPRNKLIYLFTTLRENIEGIDINPIACILCQLNLFLSLMDLIRKIIKYYPSYKFPLFKIHNKDTISFKFKGTYEFVIGNPPYLFIRNIEPSQRDLIKSGAFNTNQGQFDLYQIFIEIGIKILTKNGKLGFILPDSILALSNRLIIRKFIYENTNIEHIAVLGSQFQDSVVSNVVIIVKNEQKKEKRLKNQISISTSLQKHQIVNKIPQNLIESYNYKFPIDIKKLDVDILAKINLNPKLGSFLNNNNKNIDILLGRGVEISKKGIVYYCRICKKYMPYPRNRLNCIHCEGNLDLSSREFIINKKALSNRFKKLLYAINRYEILEYRYIDVEKVGINYKDDFLYKNRIIIRQINQNNLICATIDKFSYTTQSFYNLKITKTNIPQFTNYYLLGLVNSILLSYYFSKSFGSYKELFPRILLEKVKSLPIKIPYTDKEKKIAQNIEKRVKLLLEKNKANPSIMKEIDALIFKIYQVDERFIKHIYSSIYPKKLY